MIVTIYENLSDFRDFGDSAIIRDVDKVSQTAAGTFELVLKDSNIFIPSEYIVVITELED